MSKQAVGRHGHSVVTVDAPALKRQLGSKIRRGMGWGPLTQRCSRICQMHTLSQSVAFKFRLHNCSFAPHRRQRSS